MVKMLCSGYKVRRNANVNARNNSGLTALDLDESLRHPDEPLDVQNISKILHKAGSMRACDANINNLIPSQPTKQPQLAIHHRQRILHYINFRVREDTSLDVRNTLMVILVLIATVTFDVGINPPGGNWQDDLPGKHIAGKSIWLSNDKIGFFIFTAVNFVGFVMSSVMIFRLVEGYPYSGPVQVAQSFLVFTYVWSTPLFPNTNTVNYILLIVVIPVGTVSLLWFHRKPSKYS
ncbi:uncharacterized protein LOC122093086 [Macadamia integrifolia]|uniref:uncharacterized protein LOC122093086 n=1 Tax=Macadamia integrifolia TaxID=60698 RepID=UPI001C53033A|nr:uncharacterized protein LOC122093086 [Macadamia integrifolia]